MSKTWIDTRTDHWLPIEFDAMVDALAEADREQLVALIINTRYNEFISERADFAEGERPIDPSIESGKDAGVTDIVGIVSALEGVQYDGGKRVPYVGWYWRSTDFYNKRIPIGDCGEFIGVMENNKWDYPERMLTEEECDQVIAIIDAAMKADHAGGEAGKIRENTMRELERLWPLFQTFRI